MAHTIIHVSGKDSIEVLWPEKGQPTWLKIRIGSVKQQVWIDHKAAAKLRDELNRVLGPNKEA